MEKVRSGRQPTEVGTLAIIGGEKNPHEWRSRYPIFSHFYRGIVDRANARGFRVEEFSAGAFDAEGRRLSQVLRSRGINGVIIAPVPQVFGQNRARLDWEGFVVASLGFSLEEPIVHRACHDAFHGVQLAWSELTRRGCQRIGFHVPQRINERMGRLWLGGYLESQFTIPAPRHIPPLLDEGWEQLVAWVKRHRVDGLLGLGTESLALLQAAGYRVPDDVSYVALDWCTEHGDIGGIDQRPEQIGAIAVDLVTAGVYRNERDLPSLPQTVTLRGTWRPGKTVRALGSA